ncbi:MAG: hypothetical protein Q9224_004538, partial [Gallowayella concinna]
MPDTPIELRDPRYSLSQAFPGSKVSVNSSPSASGPAHLPISEDRFASTPETLTGHNGTNSAYSSTRELSPIRGTRRYGQSPNEIPYRKTAFPKVPRSLSVESPVYQAANVFFEEPTIPGLSTNRSLDPWLQFGPSVEHEKFDPSTKSYGATHGDVSRADFNEYKELVDEQLNQAQRVVEGIMQEMSSLKCHHANHRVQWQKELEIARTGQDQNIASRWSRAIRGEIKKPKPVIEQAIEREIRQIQSYGDISAVNEEATETPSDPPLYDNLPDKLRQMAVELLLRRSQVASIIKDWNAMETYSRQAQRLARSFEWEPLVARCAFWTGIALYHQGNWIRAYENFDAADGTKGFYIPREEILDWLTLSSQRLEDPPKLWSNLLLAVQGEQAPNFTPLGTLLEEREDLATPVTEIQDSGEQGTSRPKRSSRAKDPSISAADDTILVDAPSLEHSASSNNATLIGGGTTGAVAVTPDVHIQPLKSRRTVVPAAITLPSTVEPPRIRTSLLYTPGSHPLSGPRSNPSMDTFDSPLSGVPDEGQNHKWSLSDLGIPSATSLPAKSFYSASLMEIYPDGGNGAVSLPDRAAPSEDSARESHQLSHRPTPLSAIPAPDVGDKSPSQTADGNNEPSLDHCSPLSSCGSDNLIPPENPTSPPPTITTTS